MPFFSPVKDSERLIFTKHLATMIKAGIPLAEALDIAHSQANRSGLKSILKKVVSKVQNGKTLANALEQYPRVFGGLYTNLVSIGEESGTLEENLDFLSKQLAKDLQLKKKIQGAMLYPSLILFATLFMGGVISFFILPQLIDLFTAFDIELPLATRILLFVAIGIRDFGGWIVGGLLVISVLFYVIVHAALIKPKWDGFKFKLPLLGGMIQAAQFARFSRNLGVLVRSGVPMAQSLSVVAETVSNQKLRQDIKSVEQLLQKGQPIGEAIEKINKTSFPMLVSRMISIGERTGKVDETLLYLGDYYEEEIDNISKNLTTILEPFLLFGVGLMVAFVALAIISPIYELTGSIRR
jgi:type II secretory pathway component PulF